MSQMLFISHDKHARREAARNSAFTKLFAKLKLSKVRYVHARSERNRAGAGRGDGTPVTLSFRTVNLLEPPPGMSTRLRPAQLRDGGEQSNV